ncbi:hypothetical protein O181_024202 [Austropuccinia psidii MF-1]|uniref:Uncharacterized protein n=1 Tax=Austropuccinia psidii MF-1 TaxID=1389203 RepID=A0A9Q3CL19_9BASI|nr:hypothetical protein [Austropuccinia psidii MF-1]
MEEAKNPDEPKRRPRNPTPPNWAESSKKFHLQLAWTGSYPPKAMRRLRASIGTMALSTINQEEVTESAR